MDNASEASDMSAVNERLKEIVEAVSDESLSLDQALSLYEEAVGLGMKASEFIEADIANRNADTADSEQEEHEQDQD
ncbi:MAG: exodeoxyribonuclease VII small subunit [Eggerthellaceae bacterium]|jgi:exodeoxyribonuclease VII small subunit